MNFTQKRLITYFPLFMILFWMGCEKPPINVSSPKDILFSSNDHLFTMNSDGSNRLPLFDKILHGRTYCWASQGAKLLFIWQKKHENSGEIYSINNDGSELTRLTENSRGESYPSFSPDGNKILFRGVTRGYDSELFIMDSDGKNETQLTNFGARVSSPNWSPDGTKIIFCSDKNGTNMEIYSINKDGSNVTQLTNDLRHKQDVVFSPNGNKILFSAYIQNCNQLFTIDSDGSNEVQLTNLESAFAVDASWSPDGTKIIFSSNKDDSKLELYSMNSDGSNITRLTYSTNVDRYPIWR